MTANQAGSSQIRSLQKLTAMDATELAYRNSLIEAKQQGRSEDLEFLLDRDPDRIDLLHKLSATGVAPTQTESDGVALRTYLGTEMQTALSQKAKGKVTLLNSFNSGMKLDLDLSEAFAKQEEKTAEGELRYGLILEDVTPDPNAPERAAISDIHEELQYAGHADVKWSIGPVSEKDKRKLFNVAAPAAAAPGKAEQKESLWSRLRIPKAAFKGQVRPKNFENITKVDGDNMPEWEVKAGQAEDYYNLIYRTKADGAKINAEHEFKIPIVGTAAVGRRFDDRFHVIQTSAYDILVDTRLPLVSVHYMNMEQRYKGDIGFAFGEGKRKKLSVSGRGYAANSKESYALDYTEEF
jgi:hypothetical protein